jgi:hypothetical protein
MPKEVIMYQLPARITFPFQKAKPKSAVRVVLIARAAILSSKEGNGSEETP